MTVRMTIATVSAARRQAIPEIRRVASAMVRRYLVPRSVCLGLVCGLAGIVMTGDDLVAQTTRPAWADSLDSIANAELARTHTPGVSLAVVAEGRVVYATGLGIANAETGEAVTRETLFRVGSVSKMFTGATIAQLAYSGKVDLDAPVGQIVPELRGLVANVTLHQLLTHTAGWIDNGGPYGPRDEDALGEVMRAVTDTMFFTTPGSVFSYSNPGYAMAGYVAEVVSGQPFATLVDETVLRPLGATRATFRPLQALTWRTAMGYMPQGQSVQVVRPFPENTVQWPAGFLMASAEDIARLAVVLMGGGSLGGNAVLASEAAARVTTGYVTVPGMAQSDSTRYGYGLQSMVRGGMRVWQHAGIINGYDAMVVMLPDRKVAVVVIDNLSGGPLNAVVGAALHLAAGIDLPGPPPLASPRDPTSAERAALVGRYAAGRVQLEILDDNGRLRFRQGPATGSVQVSDGYGLVVTPPGGTPLRLSYTLGADGRAAYLHQGTRAIARQ